MSRTLQEIESDLNLLTPQDFNLNNIEANGLERLYILTSELAEINDPEKIKEILFLAIERLSNSNEIDPRSDLGTPGSFVHALEKLPNYSDELIESIRRYPTPLTVWMINRILNTTIAEQERQFWLNLLHESINHSQATFYVKEQAQDFIDFQRNQDKKAMSPE
jgi:truncated hemoglobin YjbI